MGSTRLRWHVNAPRAAVYRALLDPGAVERWMVPAGMTSQVSGTDVLAVHEGLPRGVPEADNEVGWRSSLAKLAALVEAG